MIRRFNVECAVWHPLVSAEAIEDAIGLTKKIGWSAGEIYRTRSVPERRTYCRFDLGTHSQRQSAIRLPKLLRPFLALIGNSPFNDGKGRITVYFKNLDDAAEFYVDRKGLEAIRSINADVNFR